MRILSLLVVLGLAACGAVNKPANQDGGGDQIDAGDDEPDATIVGCQDPSDCAGTPSTPFCLEGDDICVGCRNGGDCTSNTAPVCDPEGHACRGCQANEECASGVCGDLGACVNPSSVVYVANNGVAGSSCTLDMPCNSLDVGLQFWSAARSILVIDGGAWGTPITATFGGRIVGKNGATLKATGAISNPPLLQVYAPLLVEDLEITSMRDPENPAVVCAGGGDLTLRNVGVTNNNRDGVSVSSGCNFTCERSRISGNQGTGVNMFGAARVIVRACIFADNLADGMNGNPGTLDVSNSLFIHNNDQQFAYGGAIRIEGAASTTGRVVFSTFVQNRSYFEGIIGCNNTAITIDNNIFLMNPMDGELLQSCSGFINHNLADVFLGGSNNMGVAQFVNFDNRDFTLQPGSPGIDAAIGQDDVELDFYGHHRPIGAASDVGAVESH